MREIPSNNPIVSPNILWDDIYSSIQTRLDNSYRVIFILAVLIIAAIIALVTLALTRHTKPYVVMLRGNELVTINELKSSEFQSLEPKLAMNLATEFVKHLRTHAQDKAINQQYKVASYAVISGAAALVLDKYYQRHMNDRNLRTIEIHTILLKMAGEIEIRWVEVVRNQHGVLLHKKHYSAEMNYRFSQPSHDPIISRYNPLGFYITDIAWANDIMEAA